MKDVTRARETGSTGLRSLLGLGGLCALLVLSAGCGSTPEGSPDRVAHGTYYTQFGVRVEKQVCRSTNYRLGEAAMLIPVNNEVELLRTRGARFFMRLADGREFTFEHAAKHTQDTAAEAFASFFGERPVDLSVFTEDERSAIESAQVRVGMSRRAVLASIGPPPASGTPSLEEAVWRYWIKRWNTFTVTFGDGRVSSIEL